MQYRKATAAWFKLTAVGVVLQALTITKTNVGPGPRSVCFRDILPITSC